MFWLTWDNTEQHRRAFGRQWEDMKISEQRSGRVRSISWRMHLGSNKDREAVRSLLQYRRALPTVEGTRRRKNLDERFQGTAEDYLTNWTWGGQERRRRV